MCAGRADGCAGCVARGGRVGGRELGAGARAVGERQRRWGAQDERACRQLGGTAPACWACWARAAGGPERAWRGRARGGRAAGRHAGRGRRAGHGRPGRGLGAACARELGQLGQVGVLCTLTRFFWPGSTR